MPAVCAIVNNPSMKEFYERLLSKGKCKKVALVAVMRKLLVLSIGILNNNTPFDENWITKNQENNFLKNYSLAS